jgi:hypothetical protein
VARVGRRKASPVYRARIDTGTLTAASGATLPTDTEEPSPRARAAAGAFGAFIIAAFPILVFKLGSYFWFFFDEWDFLADRKAGSVDDLFRPHAEHWSTLPILAYRALFAVFGLRSYVPYQALLVTLHLSVCVLLRIIMRRAGVSPWLATVAAATFVLFGPGNANIIWAFQIGFTGALALGLLDVVLADHDGPFAGRDYLGVSAGVLALMCSGVGVAMAFVVGIATLLRRGWRIAIAHTAPLAAVYIVWWLVERPNLSTPFGRPTPRVIVDWVRSAETGTFEALGHFTALGIVLGVVLVAGAVVLCTSTRNWRALLDRTAVAVALLAGGLIFSAITAWGRWWYGNDFARQGRYLHLLAAFALPAIAVAADALARRWRPLLPLLIVLFLVPIPWNARTREFENGQPFTSAYFDHLETVARSIPESPIATRVPRSVRPFSGLFVPGPVTVGFVLDTAEHGRLRAPEKPISPELADELRVRLAVSQHSGAPPSGCRTAALPLELDPGAGTTLRLTQGVQIAVRRERRRDEAPVPYNPANGRLLTIVVNGFHLRVEAAPHTTLAVCPRR